MAILFLALFVWGVYRLIYLAVKPKKKAVFVNDKKFSSENPYIKIHEKKLADDNFYDEYLKYCKETGEFAMDKKGFNELRKKEKEFNQYFEKLGIK